jgi:chromosome segregation ATPase
MELLRNYQLRKQLGLLGNTAGTEINIESRYGDRFKDAIRSEFQDWDQPLERSRLHTPGPPSAAVSPRARSRTFVNLEQSRDQKLIIEGLEERVDSLEARNMELSCRLMERDSEMASLKKQVCDLTNERDLLSSQIRSLKSVVTNESSAGKVLERVSHSDQLEFKLEIYRQQIAMMSEEIEKLKLS